MVQRCACLVLVEYRSRYPSISNEEIAKAIANSQLLQVEQASVEKTITTMLSRGSYYRNLENALGKGVTLVLGAEIAETT